MTFRIFALLALLALAIPAAAQAKVPVKKVPKKQGLIRVPLPTDPNVSVYVGIAGTFKSAGNGQTRQMELQTDVSNYALNEAVDPATMQDHEISTMQVSDEPGWGVFAPPDGTFTFHVDITDAQGHLGSMTVIEMDTGRVVGTINAAPDGASLQGTLPADWSQVNYALNVKDKQGQPKAKLTATQGNVDSWYLFTLSGNFEPNVLPVTPCSPAYASHSTNGTQGDPKSPQGVVSGVNTPTHFAQDGSVACAYLAQSNDTSGAMPLPPPNTLRLLQKQKVIYNSAARRLVNNDFKPGDPANFKAILDPLTQLSKEDAASVMTDNTMPPYSKNCGHWDAILHGSATAVFALPYRKLRNKGAFLDALTGAMKDLVKAGTDVLSVLLGRAADNYLADKAANTSGFAPGDVVPVGDIYILQAQEASKSIASDPILQDVTFHIMPDTAPDDPTTYVGSVVATGFATAVSPPPAGAIGALNFDATGNATLSLPKGYKWKASGNIVSPDGYEGGTVEFPTPSQVVISIPCTLKVLLKLQIFTEDDQHTPISAAITMGGRYGVTQLDDAKKYSLIFTSITPGALVIHGEAAGYDPVDQPIYIAKGKKQTTTLVFKKKKGGGGVKPVQGFMPVELESAVTLDAFTLDAFSWFTLYH